MKKFLARANCHPSDQPAKRMKWMEFVLRIEKRPNTKKMICRVLANGKCPFDRL